jgi:hypothetical protein
MSKINLFEDKEFDQLDWLNRAVEPFIFPPNDVLAIMPEKFDFDYSALLGVMKNTNRTNIDLDSLVEYAAQQSGVDMGSYHLCIKEHYKIQLEPDTVMNFETRQLSGGVSIVKTKNQLTDEDIQAMLATKMYESLRGMYATAPEQIPRLNEVLDLIGSKDARGSRSGRHKVEAIAAAMTKVVTEDKWRVRNYNLMLKCADWIKDYVDRGNLASMSNFTRLKCMTHKGQPIYSMEETK